MQRLTGPDPVLEWVAATASRPIRTALDDTHWEEFRAEPAPRLRAAYPLRADGATWFGVPPDFRGSLHAVSYGRWTAAVLGVPATALIPLSFPAHGGPTAFDRGVTSLVRSAFTDESVNRALLWPSNAVFLLVLLLIGVLVFARTRSRRQVCALVVGPAPAVLLTEVLLKPAFGRHLHSPYNHRTFLDYPSGNAVALTATVTAFALIVASWRARAAIIALGVLAMAAVAISLIWFSYHYPTDIVGGICFGISVPLALSTTSLETTKTVSP